MISDPLANKPRALRPDEVIQKLVSGQHAADDGVVRTRVEEALRPFTPQDRDLIITIARAELKDKQKELESRISRNSGKRDDLRIARDILDELIEWESVANVIQKAVSSRSHDLARAFKADTVYGIVFPANGPGGLRDEERPLVNFQDDDGAGQVFVVEHDWAAAFAGAGDYDAEAAFRLPYERCTFEFCYGGKRVIVRAKQGEREAELSTFAETRSAGRNAWVSLTGPSTRLFDLMENATLQVKAICVSLEAEITTTDPLRIPDKLRKARERDGKLPPFDHHIVRLNRRPRAASLDAPASTGMRKRLHFRRGHWRHYENHRTWIKWTLCGNPDLGFVDKEYRL